MDKTLLKTISLFLTSESVMHKCYINVKPKLNMTKVDLLAEKMYKKSTKAILRLFSLQSECALINIKVNRYRYQLNILLVSILQV